MGAVALLRVIPFVVATPAAAHALAAPALRAPDTSAWWIALLLGVTAAAYAIGLSRLWRNAPGRGIRLHEALYFAAGWSVVAVALLGPVHDASERSFAAHMLQHELMMLVATPLLVAGRPLAAWSWAVPATVASALRRSVRGTLVARATLVLTRPFGATLAQIALLFVLHVPRIFDYAAAHPLAHALQHAGFFGSALAFWWAIGPVRRPHADAPADAAPGVALACLFVTTLCTGALGALLTFGATPWYAVFRGAPWAASALEDQQLGGLLMWIPGGCVYLAAALRRARDLLVSDARERGVRASVAPAPRSALEPLSTESR